MPTKSEIEETKRRLASNLGPNYAERLAASFYSGVAMGIPSLLAHRRGLGGGYATGVPGAVAETLGMVANPLTGAYFGLGSAMTRGLPLMGRMAGEAARMGALGVPLTAARTLAEKGTMEGFPERWAGYPIVGGAFPLIGAAGRGIVGAVGRRLGAQGRPPAMPPTMPPITPFTRTRPVTGMQMGLFGGEVPAMRTVMPTPTPAPTPAPRQMEFWPSRQLKFKAPVIPSYGKVPRQLLLKPTLEPTLDAQVLTPREQISSAVASARTPNQKAKAVAEAMSLGKQHTRQKVITRAARIQGHIPENLKVPTIHEEMVYRVKAMIINRPGHMIEGEQVSMTLDGEAVFNMLESGRFKILALKPLHREGGFLNLSFLHKTVGPASPADEQAINQAKVAALQAQKIKPPKSGWQIGLGRRWQSTRSPNWMGKQHKELEPIVAEGGYLNYRPAEKCKHDLGSVGNFESLLHLSDDEKFILSKWWMLEDKSHSFLSPNEVAAMFKRPISAKAALAYRDIRKFVSLGIQHGEDAAKAEIAISKQPQSIQDELVAVLEEKVSKLAGWMPHYRRGDYAAFVPYKGGGHEYNLFPKKSQAIKAMQEWLSKPGAIRDKARTYHYSELAHDIYLQKRLSYYDMLAIIKRTPNVDEETKNALLEVIAKRSRAWSLVPRRDVPGFPTTFEDILEGVGDFYERALRRESKVHFFTTVSPMVNAIKNPRLRDYATHYVRNLQTATPDELVEFRHALYGWHLAGSTSFLLKDLTQPILTTYAEGVQYLGTAELFGKEWTRAYAQAVKFYPVLQPTKNAPSWLRRAYNMGITGGVRTRELVASSMSPLKGTPLHRRRLFSSSDKFLTLFGDIAESKNRVHAFILGHNIATEKLKMASDDAFKFATRFVMRTQYPYGAHNIPEVIMEAGTLKAYARTAYMYRTFLHNTLERLFDVYTKGTVPAKLAQTFALVGLAGTMGVPGAMIARKIAMRRGVDPELAIKDWIEKVGIEEAFDSAFDVTLRRMGIDTELVKSKAFDVAMRGVPSVLKLDTSRWIGLGDAPPIGSWEQAFGVLGSIPRTARNIWFWTSEKEYGRAVETAVPTCIANPMKAFRYMKEGVRDRSGALIYDPSDIEAYIRGLGIPLLGEQKAREVRWLTTTVTEKSKKERAHYNRMIAIALFRNDRNRLNDIWEEIARKNLDREPHLRIQTDATSIRNRLRAMRLGRQPMKRLRRKAIEWREQKG